MAATKIIHYKNTSRKCQSVNLNTGRALHLDAGQEALLEEGEDQSVEILTKTRVRPPLGVVRRHQVADTAPPPVPEKRTRQRNAGRDEPWHKRKKTGGK